jgi:hypothetical protein
MYVCLHMDKLDQERVIQWFIFIKIINILLSIFYKFKFVNRWDMVQIKELFQLHVKKYLNILTLIKQKSKNMKFISQCLKFTMKKFKIY